VLILDDEETVRLVCERALTRAGYQPYVFATGAEAVAAARRDSFDVWSSMSACRTWTARVSWPSCARSIPTPRAW
jgi:DNA-binding NtrC family response regulator